MFFMHDNCGGFCHVDLTSLVKIQGTPYIDTKGRLTSNNLSIVTSKKHVEVKDIRFICEVCKDSFPPEDVIGTCGYCRKHFNIDALVTNKECGDLLCQACHEEFFPEQDAPTVIGAIQQFTLGD